jgi:repressor LexA
MDKGVFFRRVNARMQELGIPSEHALVVKAGLSRDALRQLRNDRVRSLNSDTLIRLADALESSMDWLVGRSGDNQRAGASNDNFEDVEIVGEVQAGVWREALEWPESDRYTIPVPVDLRFPGMKRRGLKIGGNSMDEIFPEGSIAFVIPILELGRPPAHGNKVIVQRARHEFYEATCKQLALRPDGSAVLLPRSSDKRHKPIILPRWKWASAEVTPQDVIIPAESEDGDENEEIVISALVTDAYTQQ